MRELVCSLRELFQDQDARYGYVEGALNAFIAAQLKELREDREMSQQQLAEAIGTKQSGISRLENANYSSWKVETLRKVARAFGVRLRISFEEFGTLIPEIETIGRRLRPRQFERDPVFGNREEGPKLDKATGKRINVAFEAGVAYAAENRRLASALAGEPMKASAAPSSLPPRKGPSQADSIRFDIPAGNQRQESRN